MWTVVEPGAVEGGWGGVGSVLGMRVFEARRAAGELENFSCVFGDFADSELKRLLTVQLRSTQDDRSGSQHWSDFRPTWMI